MALVSTLSVLSYKKLLLSHWSCVAFRRYVFRPIGACFGRVGSDSANLESILDNNFFDEIEIDILLGNYGQKPPP